MLARKNGMKLWFSDEELKVIKEVARQQAMPMTNWARRILLRETNQLIDDFRPERSALHPPVMDNPIQESVTDDYLICLEDGKKLKILKRHLMTSYGLTPREYRLKWGLPADYPMVAPNYARKLRKIAKERNNLGVF